MKKVNMAKENLSTIDSCLKLGGGGYDMCGQFDGLSREEKLEWWNRAVDWINAEFKRVVFFEMMSRERRTRYTLRLAQSFWWEDRRRQIEQSFEERRLADREPVF